MMMRSTPPEALRDAGGSYEQAVVRGAGRRESQNPGGMDFGSKSVNLETSTRPR